jgi:hypothetical protein
MRGLKLITLWLILLEVVLVVWCGIDAVYYAHKGNVGQTIFNALLVIVNLYFMRLNWRNYQRARNAENDY